MGAVAIIVVVAGVYYILNRADSSSTVIKADVSTAETSNTAVTIKKHDEGLQLAHKKLNIHKGDNKEDKKEQESDIGLVFLLGTILRILPVQEHDNPRHCTGAIGGENHHEMLKTQFSSLSETKQLFIY